MAGLVVVNKEANKTSRDVVNELNHIFATKKIGHTGTLDPIATGVLVCLVGKYTKLVDLITSYDKEYIATIKFGIKTDTLDITGTVIEKSDFNVTLDDIKNVFANFPQEYEQTVPNYSAVKIKGKKLYEYAREGIKIDAPKRLVRIYNLELLSFDGEYLKFKTKVSKGTYIRSLIADICDRLNTIGTMSELIRTKQGIFDINKSYSIEQIKKGEYKLLNIKEFLDYPIIEIPDTSYKQISNGAKIANDFNIKDKVIFTYKGKDIAIYQKDNDYLKHFLSI